jgi:serine/threonine-protein kinase
VIDPLPGLRQSLSDRYRIERELGAGGMATVYLAHDQKHDRKVAIKVLRPELAAALGTERFLREITVSAQLHHPHILPLFDSGSVPGSLYYVMPYLEGESLRDRLRREPRLPVDEGVRIAREVADALAYAHAHGVIHRDVKPENILLESGHAVVADFGIARAVQAAGGDTLTGTGIVVGTPAYLSPEQATGEQHIDGRSDIYSLACVLYETLAGAPPFNGTTAQALIAAHVTETPKSLTALRPDAPAPLASALSRALEKDPGRRFATAAEFRDALEPFARTVPRAPRRWRVLASVTALVAIVGVGLILTLGPRHTPGFDTDLIAVAPFTTLDSRLALWREGLVDILSRNLDGAGPLRTVAPTPWCTTPRSPWK